MSTLDKRREGFEAWWQGSGMTKFKDTAEAAWNAALDSIEIELPEDNYLEDAASVALDDCRDAIESAGLRVKK